MKIFLNTSILILLSFPIWAQSSDSLSVALNNAKGEEKLNLYYKLAKEESDPEKAIQIGFKYLEESKLQEAYVHHTHALNLLGILYYSLGFYESTLDFFFQMLEIEQVKGGPVEIGRIWNNIGIVYEELGLAAKALEAYTKSLDLKADSSVEYDSIGIAIAHGNLGGLNLELGDFEASFNHLQQSYAHYKLLEGEELGIFITYNSLAMTHLGMKNLDSAQYYMGLTIALNEEHDFGDARNVELFIDRAKLDFALGNYAEVQDHYANALSIARKISARPNIMDIHEGLSELYAAQNDYAHAYEHHKLYVLYNDSIFNDKNAKRISEIESDYNRKQQLLQIDELQQKQLINNLRLSQNQAMLYYLGCGLVILLILTIVLVRQNKLKNSNNKLLEANNKEIAHKNENITNSILYAKGIQQAILPDKGLLKKVFADAFVLYQARDIVNGDFYWFADMNEHFIMAVADCTGHGVPGAFMNVLGNSLLNQIVHEQQIIQPGKILEELNVKILKTMQSQNYDASHDGMDIAMVQYRKADRQVIFAGAKRPIYYVSGGKLQSIKGNNLSLGGRYVQEEKCYDEHTISLSPNDAFYLFTDGMVDQFGGEDDTKFMSYRLKTLLEEISSLSMYQQQEAVNSAFQKWRGKNEQTDDALLIGVQV